MITNTAMDIPKVLGYILISIRRYLSITRLTGKIRYQFLGGNKNKKWTDSCSYCLHFLNAFWSKKQNDRDQKKEKSEIRNRK